MATRRAASACCACLRFDLATPRSWRFWRCCRSIWPSRQFAPSYAWIAPSSSLSIWLICARTLSACSAALRGERASTALQLGIARRALRLSQTQLAMRLRTLYEQEDVDPVAIILGAASLDEAMTGIEGLGHLARQNASVIDQTRAAEAQLATAAARLASQQTEL